MSDVLKGSSSAELMEMPLAVTRWESVPNLVALSATIARQLIEAAVSEDRIWSA